MGIGQTDIEMGLSTRACGSEHGEESKRSTAAPSHMGSLKACGTFAHRYFPGYAKYRNKFKGGCFDK